MALGDMTKELLSGNTTGKQILVNAVATLGDTIHTADAAAFDEIWIWAENHHTADVILTIEWGAVVDPNDLIEVKLPLQFTNKKEGPILIIPGFVLTNSLVVTAFASVTDVVTIQGHVHRIAQS